jgi:hypothetical protein
MEVYGGTPNISRCVSRADGPSQPAIDYRGDSISPRKCVYNMTHIIADLKPDVPDNQREWGADAHVF